jgi:hypothetical protein
MTSNNDGADGGANPFGVDVDFDKVQKRREQYLARKAAERGEPLMSGMDKDGNDDDDDNSAPTQPQGRFAGVGKGLNFLMKGAGGANINNNADGGGGGGGGTLTSTVESATTTTAVHQQEMRKKKEAGVVGIFGGKKIVRWPYDDYHEVQKKYYTKLEEDALALAAEENKSDDEGDDPLAQGIGGGGGPSPAKRGFFGFGGGGGRDDQNALASPTNKQNKDVLQRPDDPTDIPTAVQGLPLSEFERKAEERAISIVSTWLFDCGLIDELLVHGGMGKSTMRTAQKHYTTPKEENGSNGNNDNTSIGDDSKTTMTTQQGSVKTSEGIEVGQFGHIIEGPSKMDKEISKLRNGTSRQLTMVNSRLNDGVAASGGEVQELVNAVNNTKDDLGRLRELSTYIGGVVTNTSNGVNGGNGNDDIGSVGNGTVGSTSVVKNNMMARSQTFMLTKYPKLKKAINARRNLARCFRELDFYSQIPVTCDRLREDLHQAEWTEVEWNSLREVSREHVELEIFLVEAEAGMKKRIDEEFNEQKDGYGKSDEMDNTRRSHLRRSSRGGMGSGNRDNSNHNAAGGLSSMMNYEEVDNFLHEHVKNVWELGDEIRMRIMSGIGSAFELATDNPGGLVALVEAVEVYETANEEYKTVHGEEAGASSGNTSNRNSTNKQNLRFTDMRASALKQMYQDFELRGLEIFREVHEVAQARGVDVDEYNDDDPEEATEYFNAILRAANELTAEIAFVQNQMSPCFPLNWALELLWSTCVAHVCSKQILDQIGGTEGHKLPDLTVTQLLDLVAWIESFRSTIEETFPNIGEHISKKTYFNKRPDLLQEDNRQIDMDVAKDSLAWANNMLWEVHDLAKDEFLFRTKEQTHEWLDNVYEYVFVIYISLLSLNIYF